MENYVEKFERNWLEMRTLLTMTNFSFRIFAFIIFGLSLQCNFRSANLPLNCWALYVRGLLLYAISGPSRSSGFPLP
jgi:hypothetical protein